MDTYKERVTLGEALRRERRRREPRLAQAEAAKLVGVSQPVWSRWEDGGLVEAKHYPAVARFLGLSVGDVAAMAHADEDLMLSDRVAALEESIHRIEAKLDQLLAEPGDG